MTLNLQSLHPDVIVVGAGMVGAACAYSLSHQGLKVLVLDDGLSGATHAGMGHLVVMDDNPAELALSCTSLALWRQWLAQMDSTCAYANSGTLWVAADEEERHEALEKQKRLQSVGVASQWLDAADLARAEPALRSGLCGGLKVMGDGVVYAPNAARWLLCHGGQAIQVIQQAAIALEDHAVRLADGSLVHAPSVVLAAGWRSAQLCPGLPLQAKKGHLAISARYPTLVQHQLVELGYVKSAHNTSGTSVAFNVQPRPTGQLLIGSSRQFDTTDPAVEPALLARMLARAAAYMPALQQVQILRCWTGLRVATPDGLPLIGPHPQWPGLYLALGHEGLGVTTATATAALITAAITQGASPLPAAPYLPARLLS